MAIQRDPNKVIKKLSVGNNYGHTATDYVGGTDDGLMIMTLIH